MCHVLVQSNSMVTIRYCKKVSDKVLVGFDLMTCTEINWLFLVWFRGIYFSVRMFYSLDLNKFRLLGISVSLHLWCIIYCIDYLILFWIDGCICCILVEVTWRNIDYHGLHGSMLYHNLWCRLQSAMTNVVILKNFYQYLSCVLSLKSTLSIDHQS